MQGLGPTALAAREPAAEFFGQDSGFRRAYDKAESQTAKKDEGASRKGKGVGWKLLESPVLESRRTIPAPRCTFPDKVHVAGPRLVGVVNKFRLPVQYSVYRYQISSSATEY